jgi:hypothetical protein
MLRSVCLVGVLLLTAAPALAQSCGSAPIAPAIPATTDVAGKTPDDAHKMVLDALHGVKAYQGSLSTYRQCLITETNAAKQAVADTKGDKDKSAAATQRMNDLQKQYDQTVDTETQVVADYSKLHDAYCKMGSGLAGCVAPAH